jgi:hypothetical protein
MPGAECSAYLGWMDVSFKRTGERRYAVVTDVPGHGVRRMDPAPGYDEHIPHDLVHYVVEAELKLAGGLFGRTAGGGGTFLAGAEDDRDHRRRQRERRKQRRREDGLRRQDHQGDSDMATSERFAGICDLAWRRRQGQQGEAAAWLKPDPLSPEDEAVVERVLGHLDEIARIWNALPVGGSITFRWPGVEFDQD